MPTPPPPVLPGGLPPTLLLQLYLKARPQPHIPPHLCFQPPVTAPNRFCSAPQPLCNRSEFAPRGPSPSSNPLSSPHDYRRVAPDIPPAGGPPSQHGCRTDVQFVPAAHPSSESLHPPWNGVTWPPRPPASTKRPFPVPPADPLHTGLKGTFPVQSSTHKLHFFHQHPSNNRYLCLVTKQQCHHCMKTLHSPTMRPCPMKTLHSPTMRPCPAPRCNRDGASNRKSWCGEETCAVD